MTIHFQAMPQIVSTVRGPVISLREPIEAGRINSALIDAGFFHSGPLEKHVTKVRLLIRRDGNYFRYPVFIRAQDTVAKKTQHCARLMDIHIIPRCATSLFRLRRDKMSIIVPFVSSRVIFVFSSMK